MRWTRHGSASTAGRINKSLLTTKPETFSSCPQRPFQPTWTTIDSPNIRRDGLSVTTVTATAQAELETGSQAVSYTARTTPWQAPQFLELDASQNWESVRSYGDEENGTLPSYADNAWSTAGARRRQRSQIGLCWATVEEPKPRPSIGSNRQDPIPRKDAAKIGTVTHGILTTLTRGGATTDGRDPELATITRPT